jgi:hypothetical protein
MSAHATNLCVEVAAVEDSCHPIVQRLAARGKCAASSWLCEWSVSGFWKAQGGGTHQAARLEDGGLASG